MENEVKRIRDSMGLSQTQFAMRFGIKLSTLRKWEQGKRQPDSAALTYLRVIEKIPEVVASAVAQLILVE